MSRVWARFVPAAVKKNKFSAQKTADGFPSKLEASVYQQLLLRERAKDIKDIRRQHCVDLGLGVRWKVDFSFTECATGQTVWAEAKGIEDRGYKLKLKMWRNGAGPGRIEIWKGTWQRPHLVEVVVPSLVRHD